MVYSSTRVVIRLQPTPAYKPPIVTKMVRVEDGAPEGVVVAHTVPLYMSWGYQVSSVDQTREGHTVTEITMQHTQLEHHLMERVEALSARLAEFLKAYRCLKSQSDEAVENLTEIEEQFAQVKLREVALLAQQAKSLEEISELKDKLQASEDVERKAQHAESVALQNLALEKSHYEKKLLAATKEAQHSRSELVQVRAQAAIIAGELKGQHGREVGLMGAPDEGGH